MGTQLAYMDQRLHTCCGSEVSTELEKEIKSGAPVCSPTGKARCPVGRLWAPWKSVHFAQNFHLHWGNSCFSAEAHVS